MVGVADIRDKLKDFIRRISKISDKKLSKKDASNISQQARIFANLLDDEGFLSQKEEVEVFAVAVSKNQKVTRSQINALNDILREIE